MLVPVSPLQNPPWRQTMKIHGSRNADRHVPAEKLRPNSAPFAQKGAPLEGHPELLLPSGLCFLLLFFKNRPD